MKFLALDYSFNQKITSRETILWDIWIGDCPHKSECDEFLFWLQPTIFLRTVFLTDDALVVKFVVDVNEFEKCSYGLQF